MKLRENTYVPFTMQAKLRINWFRVGVLAGVVGISIAAWVGIAAIIVVALEHVGIFAPQP